MQACWICCCFVLCPFPAAWELEISFELVLMCSWFCLAQLLCLIPTNTLTQFSGEGLASEVAVRHFTGFSKVFEYLSEQTQDKHAIMS